MSHAQEMIGATWNIHGLQSKYREVKEWMVEERVSWVLITETWLGAADRDFIRPWNSDSGLVSLIPGKREQGARGRNHCGLALIINESEGVLSEDVSLLHESPNRNWALWKLQNQYVIGCYFPPSLSNIELAEELERIEIEIDRLEQSESAQVWIVGDFNVTLRHNGRFQDDTKGATMREWLERCSFHLFIPDSGNIQTTVSSTPNAYGLWDLCVGNSFTLLSHMETKIDKNNSWASDHFPVLFKYTVNQVFERKPPIGIDIPRWKLSKLHDAEIRCKYLERLETKFIPLRKRLLACNEDQVLSQMDKQNEIDNCLDMFTQSISTVADDLLERLRQPIPGISRRYKSAEVRNLKRSLNTQKRELAIETPSVKRQRIKPIYDNLRKAITKEVNERWHNDFVRAQDLEPIGSHLSTLKRIRRGKEKGVSSRLSQQKLDDMAQHFESHFRPCIDTQIPHECPRNYTVEEQYTEVDQGDPMAVPGGDWLKQFEDSKTVIEALCKAKRGKSPGLSGIGVELFGLPAKSAPETEWKNHCVVQIVYLIMKAVALWGVTPTSWSKAQMICIYKRKGSRNDWSNWRPIALLEVLRKVFERLCASEITRAGFHRSQGGFRPQKSTLDQVASLNHACHIATRMKQPIFIVFLDIWAAYDTVDRNILMQMLRDRNVNERMIRIISQMFHKSAIRIIADGKSSNEFGVQGGVPQGSTISPHLYNVFIDSLFHLIENTGVQIMDGGLVKTKTGDPMCQFGFADDVALVTSDPNAMRYALELCEEHSKRFCFRWKASKTKWVSNNTNENFTLYGEEIERVDRFEYLGIPFGFEGIDSRMLVQKNIARTEGASMMLYKLGVNAYGFRPDRCVVAWKSFVRSKLDYGLAVVKLTNNDYKALDRAQRNSLRRIFGGSKGTSLDVMLRLSESENYSLRSEELQCSWLIKAFAAPENSMIKMWINDALNDKSSPLRKMMDSNKEWELISQGLGPIGHQIPSLWTDQEVAALTFRLQNGKPWNGHLQHIPNEFDNIKTIKFSKGSRTERRKEVWRKKIEELRINNLGKLVRDLPPTYKSPLRGLSMDLKQRRLLLCWWMGSLPGHAEDYCHICHESMGGMSSRLHVSRCISGAELVDLPEEEILNDDWGDPGFNARNSNDSITIAIWEMVKAEQKKEGEYWFDLVMEALKHVSDSCLGRDFGN